MPELRDWLKEVGLEHLTDVLVGNDIDFDILAELTDQDSRNSESPSDTAAGC
jgi:hypothetical protein